MKIFTFDLETQNNTSNKRVASPFDARNYIVQIGWSINGGKCYEQYYDSWHREHVLPEVLDEMGEGDVIVGFNIKFDLLWVWEEPRLQNALKRGVTIFCCQYAEYMIEGMDQSSHMVSMNEIAEKYGGGCKLDAVKEMWESGLLTSQIPRNLLTDYLVGDGKQIVGDINNTWKIYCGQIKRIKAELPPNFRKMLKLRMDGLLATTEMEYNGMFVDRQVGEELRKQVMEDLTRAEQELDGFIPPLPPELTFNWGSNTHKSCIIFGGTVRYEKWVQHKDENGTLLYAQKEEPWPLFEANGEQVAVPPEKCKKAGELYVCPVNDDMKGAVLVKGQFYLVQVRYKGGLNAGKGKFKNTKVPDMDKPKGAKKDFYFKFKGYVKPNKQWKTDSTDAFGEPMYSTGADVIDELATLGLPFTNALARRTSLSKDLGTYYWTADAKGKTKGMLTLVNEKGLLHHKLNHTSTVTSRLSSSDPNLQNLPRGSTSSVKKMFTSRFGEVDGRMAEIDYSQLEVVIQGVLTKDKQLVQDLNDRVDFHCKRLAVKLNEPYEDVLRKAKKDTTHPEHEKYANWRTGAKEFSFQRAYGAGVAAVVASTGMSQADVEALVAAEAKLYPGVAEFDKRLEASIIKNRKSSTSKLFIEGVAFTQGISHWDSPTGTRYVWREGITPEFMHKQGKYVGFSPTERKNYPVQGFGGEVVQAIIGRIFRYMLQNDRFNGDVLLVNTVHDCVWLDGKAEIIERVAKEVKAIMETIPELYNGIFPELDVNVPFPTELEIGTNLFNKAVVH